MAIEAKTVVRVETGQSVDNLKALREQAKQYRQDMEGAEIGSEKFTEAQRKLSEVSDQVKNVLMLGTKEIDDTNKSYDSLVRTMSQLTKAWRATGDEAERARLGEQILEINTDSSVDSLKKLREQAKQYRQDMEGAEIGSEKFTEAQRKLSEVSDQVKNVLMLGTKEIDDTNKSYDSLVRTMSQLTKAWRATGDEAERARLGEQILEINTQLKNLDASRGNFQRNVGNYSSAFDGMNSSMGEVIKKFPSLNSGIESFIGGLSESLPRLIESISTLKEGVQEAVENGAKGVTVGGQIIKSLFSMNTVLLIVMSALQLIIANWDKISKLWKDPSPQEKAEEAIEAMNKAIERQQNLLREQNIEVLRQYTAELRNVGGDADKAREALERYNQALKDNALAQAEANKATASAREQALALEEARARARIEELKRTQDIAEDMLGEGEGDVYDNAISKAEKALEEIIKLRAEAKTELDKYAESVVKAENDIVKAQVDVDIKRAEDAKKRREEEAKAYADYWVTIFEEEEARIQNEVDLFVPKMAEWVSGIYEANLTEFYKYVNKLSSAAMPDFDAIGDEIDKEIQANIKTTAKALKEIEEREKASKEARLAIASQLAGNMASIFEENTIAYKSFAIAEAVINTYQAATKSIAELGMPWGAAAAASALAAGFAQVKNIMSVDTSGKTTPNINGDVGAVVSAPAVVQEVPITRTITDTSVEDRLNAKLADQRVILVYSDVEEFGKRVQVQRSESSF